MSDFTEATHSTSVSAGWWGPPSKSQIEWEKGSKTRLKEFKQWFKGIGKKSLWIVYASDFGGEVYVSGVFATKKAALDFARKENYAYDPYPTKKNQVSRDTVIEKVYYYDC